MVESSLAMFAEKLAQALRQAKNEGEENRDLAPPLPAEFSEFIRHATEKNNIAVAAEIAQTSSAKHK